MTKPTVLVTATGGPTGLAVIRSLLKTDKVNIVSVDADALAPGLYIDDVESYTIPFANHDKYCAALLRICKRENVTVILPCSDEEIIEFSTKKQFFASHGTQIAIADYNSIATASDKWTMLNSIKHSTIHVPLASYPW